MSPAASAAHAAHASADSTPSLVVGERYDYIVVGAGSSGSIVAAELSADPAVRVLVLESGDDESKNPEILVAAKYKDAFINDRLMWERFSVPQKDCNRQQLYLGSGRGVGGSGSVNAMVYLRGSAFDYAQWGLPGWGWADVVPVFQRLERRLDVHRLPPTVFTETCIHAAEQAGFRRKEDLNDGTLSGYLGYEWMNLSGADRRSSYVAFLRPALARQNLRLITGATVRRVLFDSHDRASGVEYQPTGGPVTRVYADKEVILCAGALVTPRLLLLSGVGPRADLSAHGIPVVADLPGVGQNLMDHPNVSVFFLGKQPTDCSWAQLYGFHRTGPAAPLSGSLPPGEADTCYVFYSGRSSFREGLIRMLPPMALPMSIYRLGWPARVMRSGLKLLFQLAPLRRLVERLYGVVVILGKPKSRGHLRLRSARPDDPALIDPNYLGDPADLDTLVEGVRRSREIAATSPLCAWGNTELIPGPLSFSLSGSTAAVRSFVRKNVMTTYHYAGTCSMGLHEDAVVDTRLRVRGVTGLRVADASVIPVVPVSAMNGPSMMIGQRAADFIREDHVTG